MYLLIRLARKKINEIQRKDLEMSISTSSVIPFDVRSLSRYSIA